MKLTREQVWQEAVKYASENSDDGIVSLMVGFHARMNAACEVEEVDPVVEEAKAYLANMSGAKINGRPDPKDYAAFHRHMLAKEQLANDDAAPTDSDLIRSLGMMKSRIWGMLNKGERVTFRAMMREMRKKPASSGESSGITWGFPDPKYGGYWTGMKGQPGAVPICSACARPIGDNRPAFDEGRARSIVDKYFTYTEGNPATIERIRQTVACCVKEYLTCGSSGSDGGRGAAKSEPSGDSPAGVLDAPANRAGGADDDDLRTRGRRLIQSMYRDGVISDAAMHTLIRLFVSPPSDAKGFAFIDTKDDNHEEDDRCEECSCGRGATSSATSQDSSGESETGTSLRAQGAEGDAPSADAGFRWETAEEFVGDDPGCKTAAWGIGLVMDRDSAWVKRFTEGDLSILAWQDATRPMGELAPSYGVWLKDRLTQ